MYLGIQVVVVYLLLIIIGMLQVVYLGILLVYLEIGP